ncbi:hypothetical protein ACKTEK_02925 [Tepidamorphus sp. 3E244]|uniref:hypothetical protein n=1 Tax=Tepidamorphus sp. 3E244 TaxID=3385498 RepID=UPI0038FC0C11
MRNACLTVVVAIAALASPGDTTRADALAERGKVIAETHCSRCHVVGDFNKFGGVSSTPSFQLLVNHIDDWEERFLTFYTRRPHPSIVQIEDVERPEDSPYIVAPIVFDVNDVDAILAFARTLKQ